MEFDSIIRGRCRKFALPLSRIVYFIDRAIYGLDVYYI
jgi:hypothetical protein